MIFGLFKRKKVHSWEISMLQQTLDRLGPEFEPYARSIREGCIERVMFRSSDIPGYVGLEMKPGTRESYAARYGRRFEITHLKIRNEKGDTGTYTLYFSLGLIRGYRLVADFKLNDTSRFEIDASSAETRYAGDSEFVMALKNFLSNEEMALLDPSILCVIDVGGVLMAYFCDLGKDGFIAIDWRRNLYHVRSDTEAYEKLPVTIHEFLKNLT